MPVVVGIRVNPWLRAYYRRLRAARKRPKARLSLPCTSYSRRFTASQNVVARLSRGLHRHPRRDTQAELTLEKIA